MKSGRAETLSNSSEQIPARGEVWLVNFDPTIGSEIRKTRPAVVISSDAVGRLPVKLVAPLTDWKNYYARNLWHVLVSLIALTDSQSVRRSTHFSFGEWIARDLFLSWVRFHLQTWRKLCLRSQA